MRKNRWIKISTSHSHDKIVKILKSCPYSEDRGDGFILHKVRQNLVNGEFCEKIEYIEEIQTPTNSIIKQKLVNYYIVKFELDTINQILKIDLPSRRLAYFLNRFAEICKFDFSTEDISINPLLWLTSIEKTQPSPFIVNRIHLNNIPVDANISADVTLRSQQEVRSKLTQFASNSAIPQKITAIQTVNNKSLAIQLTSNGSAEYSNNYDEVFHEEIYKAMLSHMK